jgi:hypothetical protein
MQQVWLLYGAAPIVWQQKEYSEINYIHWSIKNSGLMDVAMAK